MDMDPKEFLRRLSEVSEWHRPQLGPQGSPSVSKGRGPKKIKHPGPITEQQLEAMTEHEVKRYYDQLMAWREAQPNDSVAPEIIRVKCQAKDCEDCYKHCPEGRKVEKKLHQTANPHWRELCVECQMYKSPLTGLFEIPKRGSHQFFNDYYRTKLGRYHSKYQPEVVNKSEIIGKILAQNQALGQYHLEETEDSIIRRFEQKK